VFLNGYIFYLVLLKPVCIYLYAVAGLIWIIKLLYERNSGTPQYILGSFIISVLLLLSYCLLNKKQNDYFGISAVTHDNSFANVIASNAYKNFSDKKLVTIIDSTMKNGIYYTLYYLNNDHDLIQKQYNVFPYSSNPSMESVSSIPASKYRYTKVELDTYISKAMRSKVFAEYIVNNITSFAGIEIYYIKGYMIYLLLFVEILLIVYFKIKHKGILLSHIFVFTTISGMLFSFLIMGFGQCERILTPILPFLIIFIFSFFDELIFCFDTERLVKYLNLKISQIK
jgi:hypothetical protein